MTEHRTSSVSVVKKAPASREQKKYWLEIQLVDEEGKAVAHMPWRCENDATRSSYLPVYTGKSDGDGVIRVENLHPLDLTLFIAAQPLADEMEQRPLGVVRNPRTWLPHKHRFHKEYRDEKWRSEIARKAEEQGYPYHYVTIGELCDSLPSIEGWENPKKPPAFHFPTGKEFKGLRLPASQFDTRHVVEVCPFRAWELLLHHSPEYSMANAINLGAAASLAYADSDMFNPASITQFFITQCQDLSQLPQLHKDLFTYNTMVQDVPFSHRYQTPVYLDSTKAKEAEGDTQLFYVYNKSTLIISWRGTASFQDIMTDLAFRPVDVESCNRKVSCETLIPQGKVHYGFWESYNLIERKFTSEIAKLLRDIEGKKLFICGHSLGGSLALIQAAKLKNNNPVLYTYGMPRTFTRDAINQLSSITHYRHINDADPIPAVPPEANLDNWLYKLYGPLGAVLGGLWSTVELAAYQLSEWGDCFWHHGKLVALLKVTQIKQWRACNVDFPVPQGCITVQKRLPYHVKLYLAPSLAQGLSQEAGEQQKTFNSTLTPADLSRYFPQGSNPSRGFAANLSDHFMMGYMLYINNKLLELLDAAGLSPERHYTEHREKIEKFTGQMAEHQDDIPEHELKRNELFLELEGMLKQALNPTFSQERGKAALARFAYYGLDKVEQ